MKKTIHGYYLIRENGGNGRGTKEPAQEVPPIDVVVSFQLLCE
jgi:hypothetical protein